MLKTYHISIYLYIKNWDFQNQNLNSNDFSELDNNNLACNKFFQQKADVSTKLFMYEEFYSWKICKVLSILSHERSIDHGTSTQLTLIGIKLFQLPWMILIAINGFDCHK